MSRSTLRKLEITSDEVRRVTEQLASRLRARGVMVRDNDTSDDLASLLEAVELFEAAVEARGGDLMVDEAPEGRVTEPDNPAFVLPGRARRESAAAFVTRVKAATAGLRGS
jgi:hypothetical protein